MKIIFDNYWEQPAIIILVLIIGQIIFSIQKKKHWIKFRYASPKLDSDEAAEVPSVSTMNPNDPTNSNNGKNDNRARNKSREIVKSLKLKSKTPTNKGSMDMKKSGLDKIGKINQCRENFSMTTTNNNMLKETSSIKNLKDQTKNIEENVSNARTNIDGMAAGALKLKSEEKLDVTEDFVNQLGRVEMEDVSIYLDQSSVLKDEGNPQYKKGSFENSYNDDVEGCYQIQYSNRDKDDPEDVCPTFIFTARADENLAANTEENRWDDDQ